MKMKIILPALLLAASVQAQVLPAYYKSYAVEKASTIADRSKAADDCFFFWTDTHLNANSGHAPALMNALARGTRVVWGGDAIPAFVNNVLLYWNLQTELEAGIKADVYNIRGNHELTCRNAPKSDKGETLSQLQTAELIAKAVTGQVHRNPEDPESCYYYFDAPAAKLRYVVFDTSDSVKKTGSWWCTVEGVGDKQLGWLRKEAVGSAPADYSFIFLMHVPLGFSDKPRHWKAMNFIEEVAASGRLRMVFCGHMHHDFSIFRNGVLWTCTTSDAHYQDFLCSPLCKHNVSRKDGTVLEQAFDHVAVSADLIRMTRIGAGSDRTFHKPTTVLTGKSLKLKSSTGKGTTWRIVDTDGCIYVPEPNYKGHWLLPSTIASVSSKGEIKALKAGEGLAVAMSADSSLVEFFPLNILAKKARIPDKAAFFGNSLIMGNAGYGMAAPSCRHDYYHHITKFAKRHNPDFKSIKNPVSAFERCGDPANVDNVMNDIFLSKLDGDEDLISLQLGDNVNTPEAEALFKTSFPKLLKALKAKCPKARIIWFGTWYKTEEKFNEFLTTARENGAETMSIHDLKSKETESHPGDIYWLLRKQEKTIKDIVSITNTTPAGPKHYLTVQYKLQGKTYSASFSCDSYSVDGTTLKYFSDQRVCDHVGVASHPNALGFKRIADRFIETFFITK